MVYTILRHTSASGMTRHISVIFPKIENGEIRMRDITYLVGKALGYKIQDRNGALVVGGCGMDMGFHVVYSLSHILYPDGFDCIGGNCPANDHVNGVKAKRHSDGGYALRQNWL